ncbi:hypothetical protein [Phenylobacterium deserti]|uniref:Uncharacterized protein n=1 Tax=Phenylobacterium deserti TaxID=1914756 RepID=A0A328AV72_9CAUL|nr:hypothetical protein [Phenylobacterium deserti]RAK58061.1 hypothetical protein DJ018_09180 [Phenylobacterium deserti]
MIPGSSSESDGARRPDRVRLANWLLLRFILDVAAGLRASRNPMDGVIVATISQANVAAITRDLEQQALFGGADAPPPDDQRRPISVNALANTLRAPFETVRRRVRALEAVGLCERREGGLIVPTRVVTTPEFLSHVNFAYDRLRQLHADLERYGLLPSLPPAVTTLEPQARPVRAVSRLTTDFILRVVDEVTAEVGDLAGAVLFLELVRASTESLDPDLVGLGAWSGEQVFADELRRGVRPARLAVEIGQPLETVRRHVRRLQENGCCRRATGGMVVGREVMGGAAATRVMAANLVSLDRLMAQLSQQGVLQLWSALPRGEPAMTRTVPF